MNPMRLPNGSRLSCSALVKDQIPPTCAVSLKRLLGRPKGSLNLFIVESDSSIGPIADRSVGSMASDERVEIVNFRW
jgi:hypothetical protein